MVINDTLWVTGGYNGGALSTTEYVDINSKPPTVTLGPKLPIPMSEHCVAKINDSAIFFMSGTMTYYFNPLNGVWRNGPSMAFSRRYFGCSELKSSTTGIVTKIVVAGGSYSNTTEILDLATEEWSLGKILSIGILSYLFTTNLSSRPCLAPMATRILNGERR